MNIKDIKIGDTVKIKKKPLDKVYSPTALRFWETCGGKTFKVTDINYSRNSIYLDFRDIYTPQQAGSVGVSSIERIINIYLQDDLFRL